MKIVKIFFLLTIILSNLKAQSELSIDEFLNIVKTNHPIAKRASLLQSDAAAQSLNAKGAFDPKLIGDWQAKNFQEKNYFNTSEYGVKIPTWFGIEVKGVYKTANGDFLNPEEKLPKVGQAVAGLSMPLLQGLLIDERRAGLFRAKNIVKSNENETKIVLNNLLYEASKAYYEWLFATQQIKIQEKSVALAEIRLDALKESFKVGDKPAVDTLESFIQLQERIFELNEAMILLQNEVFQLSNFIWTAKQQANTFNNLTAAADIFVEPTLPFSKNDILILANGHPELVQYEYKLNLLEIERKLKRDKLKPKLNVEYNLLGNGTNFLADALLQNYRYGVNFSFPLLLRQERGALQTTQIKLADTDFQLKNKQVELQNKIKGYLNDFENNTKQVILFKNILKSYESLLDAENQKFSIGESSVFLLNSRERKVIETQIKLLKLQVNQQKLWYSLKWAAGQLG